MAVPGVPEANIEAVERLVARLHEAFERRADRIAKLYEELEVEEQYSPEERQRLEREREERSRKYGIEVRPDGHLTPPQRFYEEGARTEDDYGDPVNWRYPLHRPENVRAALAYWARFRNYYKRQGSRNVIFKRIVQAAIRYGIVPDWDTWSQYPEARALPEELRRAFRGYPGAPEAAEALSEEGSAGGAEEPTGGEAEDANEPPEGEGESALLDRALTAEGDRPSGSASVCPELAESEGPGPGLKPPSGHEGKGGGSVEEKVSVLPEPKQEDRYEKIAGVLREALKSADAAAAIPTVWTPEIVRKPAGLVANVGDAVRSYPQLRGRPGDKVKVPRLASVEFIELTEGTAPSEPTVTLDGVEVALKEYGQLISITYSVLEDIRPDIVAAIEEMFTEAAKLKEDEVILSKLDGIAEPAATLYGGGKASEADITDADVFTPDLIARALGAIMAQGYLVRPGDLTLVIHPKQYQDLLTNTQFTNAAAWGSREVVVSGRLTQYMGVNILVSTKVPTGTSSAGTTTYHAFVLHRDAVALAYKRDLTLEQERDITTRTIKIMATHRFGAEVILPKAVVKIITA